MMSMTTTSTTEKRLPLSSLIAPSVGTRRGVHDSKLQWTPHVTSKGLKIKKVVVESYILLLQIIGFIQSFLVNTKY
jgi:hypothetical protein